MFTLLCFTPSSTRGTKRRQASSGEIVSRCNRKDARNPGRGKIKGSKWKLYKSWPDRGNRLEKKKTLVLTPAIMQSRAVRWVLDEIKWKGTGSSRILAPFGGVAGSVRG